MTSTENLQNLVDIIQKYPAPWAVAKARYADGYEGYDIVSIGNGQQEDVLEKVPFELAKAIVLLVNDSPIVLHISNHAKRNLPIDIS